MPKESSKLPLFYEVKNQKVRTWNRCAMFFRAGETGPEEAQAYLERLDDISRQHTKNMLIDIRDRGITTVRREVVGSVQ